jgi:peptidoglycan/LPS O-acetylase OafA/YrhL
VCLLIVEIYTLPNTFTFASLLQSLFWMPNLPGGMAHTFVGGDWAIAVEFQFYFAFPFLLQFFYERGVRWFVGLLCCALLARLLGIAHGANVRELSYWTIIGRIDQFLIGMLIARAYLSERDRPRRWRLLLLPAFALVVASFWWFNARGGWPEVVWWKALWPTWEGACWGAVILGYLAFAPTLSAQFSAALSRLGETSLSLYLVHSIVISVLIPRGWYYSAGPDAWTSALVSTLVLVLPITIAISFLTYHVIERPFLLRVRYLVDRPKEAAGTDAADGGGREQSRSVAA